MLRNLTSSKKIFSGLAAVLLISLNSCGVEEANHRSGAAGLDGNIESNSAEYELLPAGTVNCTPPTYFNQAGDIPSEGGLTEPADAYRFKGVRSGTATPTSGFYYIDTHYLDEFQYFPATGYTVTPVQSPIIKFAAAGGEVEPKTFVMLASAALSDVKLSVSNLTGSVHTLSSGCVTVRQVARNLKRIYPTASKDTYKLWNNWLPRWQSTVKNIPANDFREVWLSFDLPRGIGPGLYRGNLTVTSIGQPNRIIPIEINVYAWDLTDSPMSPTKKHLAGYYMFPTGALDGNPEVDKPHLVRRMKSELADYRKHHIRSLHVSSVSTAAISFARRPDGYFEWYPNAAQYLAKFLGQTGFDGTIVIPMSLWSWLWDGTNPKADIISVRDAAGNTTMNPKFYPTFDKIMKFMSLGYRQQVTGLPAPMCPTCKFKFAGEIMDEIQGHGQGAMNRHADIVKHINAWFAANPTFPKFQIYQTMMQYGFDEATMTKTSNEVKFLDPFVTIRNYIFALDTWIWYDNPARTSMAAIQSQLTATGDSGWNYGWYGSRADLPKWGLDLAGTYLWASALTVHTAWGLQWKALTTGRYPGSAFDDVDHNCAAPYVPLTSAQIAAGAVLPVCDNGDWVIVTPGYLKDPLDVMPTRFWEARAKGGVHLMYWETLLNAINAAPTGTVKTAAKNFYDRVMAMHRYEPIPAAIAPSPAIPCSLDIRPVTDAVTASDGLDAAMGASSTLYSIAGRVAHKRFKKGADWECLKTHIVTHIERLKGIAPATAPVSQPPITQPTTPSTPRKFDFGPASAPLMSGYTPVSAATAYNSTAGYGWNIGTREDRDRGGTWSALLRDFALVTDATFAVKVPNGQYKVRIDSADLTYTHESMSFYIEGALVKTMSLTAGVPVFFEYNVTVADGILTIRMAGNGTNSISVPNYAVVNGITITP